MIGLSKEQIITILSEEIQDGKIVSSSGLKDVISTAITENNKKILEDVQKLISENGTAKFA